MDIDLMSQMKKDLQEDVRKEANSKKDKIVGKGLALDSKITKEKQPVTPDKKEKSSVILSSPKRVKQEEKRESTRYKGVSINLIPYEMRDVSGTKKRKTIIGLILAITLGIFICFGVYIVLDYFEKNTQKEIALMDFELKEYQSKVLLFSDTQEMSNDLQYKIDVAKTILSNHFYWSNILKFLEDMTVPTVYYEQLTGDPNGISVSAYALDYQSVARQLLAMQENEYVKEVGVSGITLETLGEESESLVDAVKSVIRFDLHLKLDPVVFTADWLRENISKEKNK